jgi:hypothetical protein
LGTGPDGGVLSFKPFGGEALTNLYFKVNGATYPFLNFITSPPKVAINAELLGLAPNSPIVYRAGYAVAGDGGGMYYTLSASNRAP